MFANTRAQARAALTTLSETNEHVVYAASRHAVAADTLGQVATDLREIAEEVSDVAESLRDGANAVVFFAGIGAVALLVIAAAVVMREFKP